MTAPPQGFWVGVDFGTTFTCVAFAYSSSPEEVKLVHTWPNGRTGGENANQVPSIVQYTNARRREFSWGYVNLPTAPSRRGAKEPEKLQWFKLLLQDDPQLPPARRPPPPPLPATEHKRRPSVGDALLRRKPSRLIARMSALLKSEPVLDDVGEAAEGETDRRQQPPPPQVFELDAGPSKSLSYVPPINPATKTAKSLRELGIGPTAVVADFLTEVRKMAVDSVRRTWDFNWVGEAKISYILTVPAIWSDSAKNLMVEAAEKAGFGKHRTNFHLVSEPEAAAAYALKVVQPHHLNLGDNFIICDAGGGTVDLISYKITNLNPLKIDESVRGTGDMCGSVFLDERFELYMRKTLGDDVIDNMKPRSRTEMMRTWEEKVKFRFGSESNSDDWEITVPGVPDSEENNVEEGFHYMKNSAVETIFNPIVDRVVQLVKQQVREVSKKGEVVAAIILVGGFGSSQYLLRKLQRVQFNRGPITVIQPVNARTAIARGALQRGLEGSMVHVRRSRRHYGCVSNTYYAPGMRSESHKYWCERNERHMIPDKMNWYIKKDDEIGEHLSVSFRFCRFVEVPVGYAARPNFTFSDPLYVCDLDAAPDFKWRKPNAVKYICTIRSDMSSIPVSRFEKKKNNNGHNYYRVEFALRLSIDNEVMKFEMLFEGQSCGLATARFDQDE